MRRDLPRDGGGQRYNQYGTGSGMSVALINGHHNYRARWLIGRVGGKLMNQISPRIGDRVAAAMVA